MVGVVEDDEENAIRGFVDTHKIGWPVALGGSQQAALDFGTTGQPETYVISPDGVAVCGTLGPSSQAAARQVGAGRAERASSAYESPGRETGVAVAGTRRRRRDRGRRARHSVAAEQLADTRARNGWSTRSPARCVKASRCSTATRSRRRAIRADIPVRIKAGQTDEEIRNAYVRPLRRTSTAHAVERRDRACRVARPRARVAARGVRDRRGIAALESHPAADGHRRGRRDRSRGPRARARRRARRREQADDPA